MTSLSALSSDTRPESEVGLRAVPWRRMVWVTWRQHRSALIGSAVLLVAVAFAMWLAGLQLHHAYSSALACRPPSSFACGNLVNRFNGTYDFLANGAILQVVPVLIGAFIGAPVLARELESGTFRFAWTQGFGRVRWTVAKVVALGVAVTAATGAISVLLSWYFQPYFASGNQALYDSRDLPLSSSSPFSPLLFDLHGVTYPAWTLVAFALGVLAGVLIRRVVPAIVATLVVYAGLAFAVAGFLRQHYVTPLVTSKLSIPQSAWVISQQWSTKGGQPASQAALNQVLQGAPGQLGGKGGVPHAVTAWRYLNQHGFTQLTTYQPATRFWTFQWIEAGWLVALSALLLGITIWLVHKRPT